RQVVVGGFTGHYQSSDHPVYLFDPTNGRITARSRGFGQAVLSLAFSPDGARIAATFGRGESLRMLAGSNLSELAADDASDACKSDSYSADFDPRSRLVTTCYDGIMRLYDVRGQRLAARRVEGGKRPFGARFSPDGTRIAVGFADSATVTVVSGTDL